MSSIPTTQSYLKPQFSHITVNESPVKKIFQCGNLTGNTRRVRDLAAELYNLVQDWNSQYLIGVQVLNTVMGMKVPHLNEHVEEQSTQMYPEGLEEQCEELDRVVRTMTEIVANFQTISKQMHSVGMLERMQDNKSPLFLTWSPDRYAEVVDSVCEAYRLELQAKDRVKMNIAHCRSKEEIMYYMALWVHQPYIDSNVELLIESLLHETGHR